MPRGFRRCTSQHTTAGTVVQRTFGKKHQRTYGKKHHSFAPDFGQVEAQTLRMMAHPSAPRRQERCVAIQILP